MPLSKDTRINLNFNILIKFKFKFRSEERGFPEQEASSRTEIGPRQQQGLGNDNEYIIGLLKVVI